MFWVWCILLWICCINPPCWGALTRVKHARNDDDQLFKCRRDCDGSRNWCCCSCRHPAAFVASGVPLLPFGTLLTNHKAAETPKLPQRQGMEGAQCQWPIHVAVQATGGYQAAARITVSARHTKISWWSFLALCSPTYACTRQQD